MADLYNNARAFSSIGVAARTSTLEGTAVDRANFDSVMALVHVGTVTDGTHTLKLQDSDDNAEWEDVAAADLQGEMPALTSASDAGVVEVGYLGRRRYVRAVATVAAASTGGVYGVTFVGGHPFVAPVDRTPPEAS